MQCLEPLIHKSKHSGVQDITLLSNALDPLQLVTLNNEEILVRWVNFQISKTMEYLHHSEAKSRVELK